MSRDPQNITGTGVTFFDGSVPDLLIETCIRVKLDTDEGVIEIGDYYMDDDIEDILRKSKKETVSYEVILSDPAREEGRSVELNSDKVEAYERRTVHESVVLAQYFPRALNYDTFIDSMTGDQDE